MFDLGLQELVVIFVVALLVFGPKRLPELAKGMGKGIGQLKKAMMDVKHEVEREMKVQENLIKHDIPSWKNEDLANLHVGKPDGDEAEVATDSVGLAEGGKEAGKPATEEEVRTGRTEDAGAGAKPVSGDDR